MTFKETKQKIKNELTIIAEQIKRGKAVRKPHIYEEAGESDRNANGKLFMNRIDFRHIHIAYCEFFNRTPRAMIEIPRENNMPNSNKIDSFKKAWDLMIEVEPENIEEHAEAA